MFRNPWRRSIAFQLWIRLSLALVAFALLVYPVYLWYQTNDNIDHARKEASVRATVVGGALANSGKRGPITAGPAGTAAIDKPVEAKNGGVPPPDTGGDELEALLVDTFGLRALEQFDVHLGVGPDESGRGHGCSPSPYFGGFGEPSSQPSCGNFCSSQRTAT